MTEYVEVTIRVPKRLLEILEAEDYLGWKPHDFYENAIRSLVGITIKAMRFEDMEQFNNKYGKNVDTIYLKSTRTVDC